MDTGWLRAGKHFAPRPASRGKIAYFPPCNWVLAVSRFSLARAESDSVLQLVNEADLLLDLLAGVTRRISGEALISDHNMVRRTGRNVLPGKRVLPVIQAQAA